MRNARGHENQGITNLPRALADSGASGRLAQRSPNRGLRPKPAAARPQPLSYADLDTPHTSAGREFPTWLYQPCSSVAPCDSPCASPCAPLTLTNPDANPSAVRRLWVSFGRAWWLERCVACICGGSCGVAHRGEGVDSVVGERHPRGAVVAQRSAGRRHKTRSSLRASALWISTSLLWRRWVDGGCLCLGYSYKRCTESTLVAYAWWRTKYIWKSQTIANKPTPHSGRCRHLTAPGELTATCAWGGLLCLACTRLSRAEMAMGTCLCTIHYRSNRYTIVFGRPGSGLSPCSRCDRLQRTSLARRAPTHPLAPSLHQWQGREIPVASMHKMHT